MVRLVELRERRVPSQAVALSLSLSSPPGGLPVMRHNLPKGVGRTRGKTRGVLPGLRYMCPVGMGRQLKVNKLVLGRGSRPPEV